MSFIFYIGRSDRLDIRLHRPLVAISLIWWILNSNNDADPSGTSKVDWRRSKANEEINSSPKALFGRIKAVASLSPKADRYNKSSPPQVRELTG
jgi:hypothetical protein